MPFTFAQTSFKGGVWSATAQGRFDDQDYRSAMSVCFNGLPIEEEAWTRRPGTVEAGFTNNGAPARVMTYAFQQNMPYVLELTDNNMRFFTNGYLAFTNDATEATTLSTANPAKLTLAVAVTWATGDVIYLSGLGTSCPTLQNRPLMLTEITDETFTLVDALSGTSINGATVGSFPSSGVIANHVSSLVTPWGTGTWQGNRLIQGDGSAIILNAQFTPYVLAVATPPSDTAYATFTLDPANFIDGPYIDPQTNGADLLPQGTTGVIELTITFQTWLSSVAYPLGTYVIDPSNNDTYVSLIDANTDNIPHESTAWQLATPQSAINNGAGFQQTDIGRHIRLFSAPPLWVLGGSYSAGNVVEYDNEFYSCLNNNTATTENAPNISDDWGVYPIGATWTWGKILSISNSISGGSLTGTISDMSNTANAFNGVLSQPQSNSAYSSTSFALGNGQTQTLSTFIGGYFSPAGEVSFMTFYPANNGGIVISSTNSYYSYVNVTYEISLYGSDTSPGSPTAGALLDIQTVNLGSLGRSGTGPYFNGLTGPITLYNPTPNVTYNYYWLTLTTNVNYGSAYSGRGITGLIYHYVGQLVFSQPPSNSTTLNVELFGPQLLYSNAITLWQIGLFTSAGPWPTCGTYHEGRLWLAGATPNRLDGSQPNQDWSQGIDFGPSNLDSGTVTDANAVSYTLNAPDVNSILWMIPDQQGILIGTEKGEWLMQSTTVNDPITPTNAQVHLVTRIGSALSPTAEPVRCEHTLVFIQRWQRRLMEYFADVFSGKFSAPNLAHRVANITAPLMDQIAYQQSLSPIVWAHLENNTFVGLSYKRDNLFSSQGPNFMGWHTHTLGSGRSVTSIASAPSLDGTTDTLAMVTFDGVYYHVEFLTNLWEEGDAPTDAWFVDGGTVPSAWEIVIVGGVTYLKLFGLWPNGASLLMNGFEPSVNVDVFCSGLDLGTWPLQVDGTVSIPFNSDVGGGLFTQALINSFTTLPVVVGFSYASQGAIVPPQIPQDTGSRAGPAFGKKRRINKIMAKMVDTQGISFGPRLDNLKTALLKTAPTIATSSGGGNRLSYGTLFTGTWQQINDGVDDFENAIAWQISRPWPATVTVVGGSIAVSELD